MLGDFGHPPTCCKCLGFELQKWIALTIAGVTAGSLKLSHHPKKNQPMSGKDLKNPTFFALLEYFAHLISKCRIIFALAETLIFEQTAASRFSSCGEGFYMPTFNTLSKTQQVFYTQPTVAADGAAALKSHRQGLENQ